MSVPTPEEARNSPLRRCIVSGESLPKDELLRFVVGPGAALYPDLQQKLPGKGIWVKAEKGVVAQAVARNLFSRAAKATLKPAPELPQQVEDLMRSHVLQMLGMIRRSGQWISGFEKVKEALSLGKARALIQASDGGEDGREKLRRQASDVPAIELFTREELALATGLENPVHNAVISGQMAAKLRFYAGKYQHYIAH